MLANKTCGSALTDNYVESFGSVPGTWYALGVVAWPGGTTTVSGNNIMIQAPAGPKHVCIGVAGPAQGEGVVNVVGNAIRGIGGKVDVGLGYSGGGAALKVLSESNHVESVGIPREVGPGATLVTGL